MRPEFRDYVLELLAPLGDVSAKRMFGGGGLFLDGSMFGLIADDVLFFKVDDGNSSEYDDADAPVFTYQKGKREVIMSYREVPPHLMEDSDLLCQWAKRAWEAARRSGKSKGRA